MKGNDTNLLETPGYITFQESSISYDFNFGDTTNFWRNNKQLDILFKFEDLKHRTDKHISTPGIQGTLIWKNSHIQQLHLLINGLEQP